MKKTKPVFKARKGAVDLSEEEKIKVANVAFGFANQGLIELLKKRGKYLTKGHLNKIENIEKQINHHTQSKHLCDEIMRPVQAYVTFKYQNGMERCINHFSTEYSWLGKPIPPEDPLMLFDEILHVDEASEPSNIIWENL